MRGLMNQLQLSFTADWLRGRVSLNPPNPGLNATQIGSLAQQAPQILSLPVAWGETNIGVANAPVTNEGLGFGLVLMLFFLYAAVQNIANITKDYAPTLNPSTVVSLRFRLLFFYATTLSLFYSLIMVAFRARFTFGNWMAFWMLHLLHLLIQGLALFNLGMLFRAVLRPAAFLAFIIINYSVSGLTEAVIIASPFYKWGYAIPMYNTVAASRTLLFGSFNRTALNVGLLFGWVLFLGVVYVVLQYQRLRDPEKKDMYFIAPAGVGDMMMIRQGEGGVRQSQMGTLRDRRSSRGPVDEMGMAGGYGSRRSSRVPIDGYGTGSRRSSRVPIDGYGTGSRRGSRVPIDEGGDGRPMSTGYYDESEASFERDGPPGSAPLAAITESPEPYSTGSNRDSMPPPPSREELPPPLDMNSTATHNRNSASYGSQPRYGSQSPLPPTTVAQYSLRPSRKRRSPLSFGQYQQPGAGGNPQMQGQPSDAPTQNPGRMDSRLGRRILGSFRRNRPTSGGEGSSVVSDGAPSEPVAAAAEASNAGASAPQINLRLGTWDNQ
ncbi:hypothetical protein HK102_008186 [Quaeritorhiza haematococci]|nr:hypothetical protein HK102_008186 [Quaeritorhiza haematococci]